MLITTGYNFEGYTIIEYLGVFSGECVLGTGFLSSLGAGFSDMFGTNSGMYAGKLRRAKQSAMNVLERQVREIGANAIIGLDIDYTTFSADIMGVIANGTAVKIVKNTNNVFNAMKELTIGKTNKGLDFRVSTAYASPSPGGANLSLEIFLQNEQIITALMADISIQSIFGEIVNIDNKLFMDFSNSGRKRFRSASVELVLPENMASTLKSIDVIIRKYVLDDVVYEVSEENLEKTIQGTFEEENSTQNFYAKTFLLKAEQCANVRELMEFVEDYEENYPGSIPRPVINIIQECLQIERMYGSGKNSCLQKLKQYFEDNIQ